MSDKQIQQLNGRIRDLKVNIFDLNEELNDRRRFETEFFGALADLLSIAQEEASDPNAYIKAIVALKEQVSAPVEGESAE